ncbi:MAG: hypothetical protein VX589_09235 [Myxococcota bacterium]|nr:hypothetical protein [Myxococcota bacterium]
MGLARRNGRLWPGGCFASILFFSCACWAESAPKASANAVTNDTVKAAERLESQGQSFLTAGDLRAAANALMAASRLKPNPAALIRLVSLYADLGRALERPTLHCDDVREVFELLFKACAACTTEKTRQCRVCRFVHPSPNDYLGHRVKALADAFDMMSEAVARRAADLSGAEGRKALRKSEGLRTTSKDARLCLGFLDLSVTPEFAAVRIDGMSVPRPQGVLPVLAGRHDVIAQSDGLATVRQAIRVQAGKSHAIAIRMVEEGHSQSTKTTAFETETRSEPIQTRSRVSGTDQVWGWVSLGSGTALIGTAIALHLMADNALDDAARADAEALTAGTPLRERLRLISVSDEKTADSESLRWISRTTGIVGLVGLGVGLWLLFTAEDVEMAFSGQARGAVWSIAF